MEGQVYHECFEMFDGIYHCNIMTNQTDRLRTENKLHKVPALYIITVIAHI